MTTELHLKYRPSSWEEVLGQRSVVKSLKQVLNKGLSRTFLLTGPSGMGKTTVARLIAKHVGCDSEEVLEIDGATNTGIDDMREIASRLHYASVGGSPRCVIVDECHAISRPSFQSLLKILEEPPPAVYWVLCTTEEGRVPKQIKTRCTTYALRPVSDKLLRDLLVRVREEEGFPISDKGLRLVVEASEGSPRQALVFLAKCSHLKKSSSIRSVLEQSGEPAEVIDLCRALLRVAEGYSIPWPQMAKLMRGISMPPETVRIIVLRYMSSVVLGGSTEKAAAAVSVMINFRGPFLDREGSAPLTLACAMVWGGED